MVRGHHTPYKEISSLAELDSITRGEKAVATTRPTATRMKDSNAGHLALWMLVGVAVGALILLIPGAARFELVVYVGIVTIVICTVVFFGTALE